MRRGSQAGFSLVEMLVATALFGLLSSMMLGGLHLGTRVMESGAKRIEHTSRVSSGYELLRREIAQAQPLSLPGTADRITLEFDGTWDAVTFVSLASPFRTAGGYQQITIRPEQGKLLATWRPYARTGETVPAGGRDSVLLDGVAVEFSYFGALRDEKAPRWHREWRNQGSLPALIGIGVFYSDGRAAPGLMIAPRLAGGYVDG